MKTSIRSSLCLSLALAALLILPATTFGALLLKNRYSFSTTPGGTNVTDSVGAANGYVTEVNGGGPALSSFSGSTLFLNTNNGSWGAADFVQLPAGMISTKTNVTIEVWYRRFTDDSWARVWDFGSYFGGSLPARSGGYSWFACHARHGGANGTGWQISANNNFNPYGEFFRQPAIGTADGWTHLVAVYNRTDNRARLYVNGQVVINSGYQAFYNPPNLNLSSIIDTNCMLGLSQYQDPSLVGEFDEFRIWEGELRPELVRFSYLNGPNTVNTNVGVIQSLTLNLPATVTTGGGAQAAALAAYANASGVDVTLDATYYSSNPAKAMVNSQGTVIGVQAGSVTISAVYSGLTNSKSITVQDPPAGLKYRWSFNEPAGSLVATDSVSNAKAYFTNGAGLGGDFTGAGEVYLGGGGFVSDCDPGGNGYIKLPNNILPALSNITIEVWTTWSSITGWAALLDLGNNSAGEGCSSRDQIHQLQLMPRRGDNNNSQWRVQYWDGGLNPEIQSASFPVGEQVYLVCIYDPVNKVSAYYTNGALAAIATQNLVPLSAYTNNVNNYLGRSNWSFDPYYNGYINELRIWEGVLTPTTIAEHFASGPNTVSLPRLTISPSGANVIVSWPASGSSGFALRARAPANTGTWTTVVPAPAIVGANYQVSVPATNTVRFFQLQNP